MDKMGENAEAVQTFTQIVQKRTCLGTNIQEFVAIQIRIQYLLISRTIRIFFLFNNKIDIFFQIEIFYENHER
jgi:hypothetical protein